MRRRINFDMIKKKVMKSHEVFFYTFDDDDRAVETTQAIFT